MIRNTSPAPSPAPPPGQCLRFTSTLAETGCGWNFPISAFQPPTPFSFNALFIISPWRLGCIPKERHAGGTRKEAKGPMSAHCSPCSGPCPPPAPHSQEGHPDCFPSPHGEASQAPVSLLMLQPLPEISLPSLPLSLHLCPGKSHESQNSSFDTVSFVKPSPPLLRQSGLPHLPPYSLHPWPNTCFIP